MTLEEQIKIGEDILQQVRDDIVTNEARLSNIQNEIAERVLVAEKAVEEQFTARMVQLEHDYQKKKEEQDKRQAYLDDYMVRLDTKDMEASAKEVSITKREETLKETSNRLASDIAKFNSTLNDADNTREKQIMELSARAKAQIEKDQAQDLREKNLNEREASFEVTCIKIENKISENKAILAQNETILAEINTKKISIDTEVQAIKESLDSIEKEKQNLIQLSAIKDDIQKFEDEKKAFEKHKVDILQISKSVEARDKLVTEKETTAAEKEKYQAIRERQIQGKIEILQKIRQGDA